MGSILKVVYDHWVPVYDNVRAPLPNGRHNLVNQEIKKKKDIHVWNSLNDIPVSHQAGIFDHSNFYSYFARYCGVDNVISTDEIKSDESIYLYPIEIRTSIDTVYKNNKFTFNGTDIEYNLIDTISDNALNHMRNGNLKVLINMAHDPLDSSDTINKISNHFKNFGIDPNNVIVLLGNDLNKEYKRYYFDNITLVYTQYLMFQQAARAAVNYPFTSTLGYVSDLFRESDLNNQIKRPKKFLSFNRTMRDHRYALMYYMIKNNILSENVVSFLNDSNISVEGIVNKLRPLIDVDESYCQKIKELLPYQLDTQHLTNDQRQGFTSDNTLKEFYQNTYLSICTETRFSHGETVFVSEKLWKPIANLHPFILLGNYGTLKWIKELGFKTFHPFIDESYDSETNPKLRLKMIFNEIDKLNNMSIDEIHNWYYSITDILIHNQQHLLTFQDINPFETVYEQIKKVY